MAYEYPYCVRPIHMNNIVFCKYYHHVLFSHRVFEYTSKLNGSIISKEY